MTNWRTDYLFWLGAEAHAALAEWLTETQRRQEAMLWIQEDQDRE